MRERARIINGEKKEDGLQRRLCEKGKFIVEMEVVVRRRWRSSRLSQK